MGRITIMVHDDGRYILTDQRPDYDGNWQARYFGRGASWENVQAFSLFDDEDGKTPGGVRYHDELANCNGSSFSLFAEPHHTREDIARAKAWIRNRRDVVSIRVRRLTTQVECQHGQTIIEPIPNTNTESSQAPSEPGKAHGEYGPSLEIVRRSGFSQSKSFGHWRWCADCAAWVKGVGIIGGIGCPKCNRSW